WRELARHLSARDPERLFLEDVNIPKAPNVERWNTDYPKIVRAMREGAPQHTLIASANWRVTPNQYDDILGLERMEPTNDPNVVYNFHFYDPFVFTHQNTDWGWEMLKLMHDLPYPSSPESVAPILSSTDERARNIVEGYGREAWNADKIVQQLQRISAWGHAHGVSVTCNEFGTWRQVAPAPRVRYLRDTCRALDSLYIGWTVFDYDGRFRITTEQAGRRALDPTLLKALTTR
ncbi:MAG: Cellulase, partial [Chthonomonadaceae bacterium]|nr:Cellulase [Chthonomonadaceae bacterium]